MKEVSYGSAANGEALRKNHLPEMPSVTDIKTAKHTMDVTALMNMLDKNRDQKREGERTLFALDDGAPKPDAAANKPVLKEVKEAGSEQAVAPATPKKSANAKKKSTVRGASPVKKEKKPAEKKNKAAAAPSVKTGSEASPIIKGEEAATELHVPASVAVSRLQVDRNTRQYPRDVQVKTQTDSRRVSPHQEGIAPVEYATVATLMAVAVAVLVAIFYLVNDKGDILPTASTVKLNQVVVHEAEPGAKPTEPVFEAIKPAANAEKPITVEEELLNIISR